MSTLVLIGLMIIGMLEHYRPCAKPPSRQVGTHQKRTETPPPTISIFLLLLCHHRHYHHPNSSFIITVALGLIGNTAGRGRGCLLVLCVN